MNLVRTKILFVCSGNVFRSMCAEYSLKKYCELHNITDISVESAGIYGDKKQDIRPEVIDEFKKLDVNITGHKSRKLTKEMLDNNDLIISMGLNHKKYIKDVFGYHSVLFEEVCLGNKEPILDNNESLKNYTIYSWQSEQFNRQMVRNIYNDVPLFMENYKRFI